MVRIVLRLRIAIAVAAAAPAASNAVPASTFGRPARPPLGRVEPLAALASMAEILGATFFCTATLPRAARTAIQARALPTLGLAQSAAAPAPALIAAFVLMRPAW